MMNVLRLNKDDVEGLPDMKGALELVAGMKPERTNDGKITIFDSGMACDTGYHDSEPRFIGRRSIGGRDVSEIVLTFVI